MGSVNNALARQGLRTNYTLVFLAVIVSMSCASTPIRVASFNILSPNYLSCGGYDSLPEKVIGWEKRKHRLLKKVIESHADIVCLQEIDTLGFQFFQTQLAKLDYQAVFAQSPKTHRDSVATFYKTGSFSYQSHTVHSYPDTHKSFLIVELVGARPLTVINTKFKWDKNQSATTKHKGYQQAKYLATYLDNRPSFKNMVLCGDFNAADNSPVIDLLKRNFKDVFAGITNPTFHSQNRAKRIDYIMVTPDLIAKPIVSQADQHRLSTIPSLDYPSDHLMILASIL